MTVALQWIPGFDFTINNFTHIKIVFVQCLIDTTSIRYHLSILFYPLRQCNYLESVSFAFIHPHRNTNIVERSRVDLQ